jgi:hypothetical protein
MTTRPVPLKPGNAAWIVRRKGDRLGNDLCHNDAVLIIGVDGNWTIIRTHAGSQRRIPTTSLDAGKEYQGSSGYWYPEDHPLVHRTLEQLIETLEAENGSEQEIERLRGILNRHFDVE